MNLRHTGAPTLRSRPSKATCSRPRVRGRRLGRFPLERIGMPTVPRSRLRAFTSMGAFLLALTLGASVAAQPAHAAEGGIVGRGAPNAVRDSYIVVLKDS